MANISLHDNSMFDMCANFWGFWLACNWTTSLQMLHICKIVNLTKKIFKKGCQKLKITKNMSIALRFAYFSCFSLKKKICDATHKSPWVDAESHSYNSESGLKHLCRSFCLSVVIIVWDYGCLAELSCSKHGK